MINKKILLYLIVTLSIIQCVDPIDLVDSDQAISMLIITGKLTKTSKKGSVAVDLIQSTFLTDRSFGVTPEEIALVNNKGEKLLLDKLQIGRYAASETPSFPFEYGEKYQIRVVNNNEIYESDFMELENTASIINTTFDFTSVQSDLDKGFTGKLDINVNTVISDTDKNKILKWELLRSYKLTEQEFGDPPGRVCYILDNNDDKLNQKLLDGREFKFNEPFGITVATKAINDLFAEGTYYTIIQEAINLPTYKYFLAYNNLVQREGNIFETPPGPMPTNFRCVSDTTKMVNGFFYAVQQDTARIFIAPDQVGNPKKLCPVPPIEFNECPVVQCCDCLKLKNGTIRKPFYWN